MAKFFVVGSATVDQMYMVSRVPDEGEQLSCGEVAIQAGGAGATLATALAQLGNTVRLAARTGNGAFSRIALRQVRAAGVDMACVQQDPTQRTSSIILLVSPDQRRTMVSYAGASEYLDVRQLREEAVASCDALVMSGYSLTGVAQRTYAMRALAIARAHRLSIFVDLGGGVVRSLGKDILDLIGDIDYLLMNKYELLTLTGHSSISAAVAWLSGQGIKHMVIKVGAMGSIVVTPEFTDLVDIFDVEKVVDTTGAGDYYTAAFAHGVMQGAEMRDAATMGSIAGALNATMLGAQSYPLSRESLESHLRSLDNA